MKNRWVLYDRVNDSFLKYVDNGETVFFDSEEDAKNECYGNEEVLLYDESGFFRNKSLLEETN